MSALVERLPDSVRLPEEPIPGTRRSWLMNYLPGMYASDDFMARFLCIFEDTLNPLMMLIDNLHYYFDPRLAPPEMVDWLATWVALALDENWPLKQRRELIHSAADLYSRRGTKAGLTEYIKLYIGVEPEIAEYVDGMTLGPETQLGVNTTIAGRERHSFTVKIKLLGVNGGELVQREAAIRRIIESEKPAHTAYRLNIITNS